jgi:glyoxylate/hydroxypyruvate reductase A
MSIILLMSTLDLRDDLAFPGHEVRVWPETGDLEGIDYVVVWGAFKLDYSSMPRLKAIFSLGAGIDHMGDLSGIRDDVSIIRFIDPLLTEEMRGYIVLNVLRFHRRDGFYRARQAESDWAQVTPAPACDVGIGIAGAGVLGAAAAKALVHLGFNVAVWSRAPKHIEGAASFDGQEALPEFLARTDILVSLLPLTDETHGLWNGRTFDLLPRGAFVINAGRGGSLVEEDLLAALESGQIAGTALDVFEQEPLPEGHPFWDHEQVYVTPHIASLSNPQALTAYVTRNIERLEMGEAPEGLIDRQKSY